MGPKKKRKKKRKEKEKNVKAGNSQQCKGRCTGGNVYGEEWKSG
jgi:hypothetical protein